MEQQPNTALPHGATVLVKLIHSVADGDAAALAKIYELTAVKIRKTCSLSCRDVWLIDDLVQETYLKVWLKAGEYDHRKGNPISWLAKIAKNTSIDALRRELRRPVCVLDDAYEFADERPDPEEAAVANCFIKSINHQIDLLPMHYREPIVTVFRNATTYAKYSEDNCMPVGTVKSSIRRGLGKVRASMIMMTA